MEEDFWNLYGFTVIDSSGFKSSRSKVECFDKSGYKVITTLDYLRRGHLPAFVAKGNPYTVWNINNVWIPMNAPDYKLLSNNFINSNDSNLNWCFIPTGETFFSSWSLFSKKKNFIKNKKKKAEIIKDIESLLKKEIYKGWELDKDYDIKNVYYTDIYLKHKDGWRGCTSFASLKNSYKVQLFVRNFQDTSTHNMYLWNSVNGRYEIMKNQLFLGSDKRYKFTCERHGEFLASWSNVYCKNTTCNKCYRESNFGKNHPSWKGGITPLQNYLRACTRKWIIDSLIANDNKCVITGLPSNTIHHLYGFELIVNEILEDLNLEIKKVEDYTEEEIKNLKNLCLKKHYKYGLGVCLTDEIHKKFHNNYGYGNNTPCQFENFYKKEKEVLNG